MNINASLIYGLALQWVEKKYPDELSTLSKRQHLDVRIYEATGAGYYFVAGYGPGKWYHKSNPADNHYTNCQISEVQAVIDSGDRVQIVGLRGQSFGVWKNWGEFNAEVINHWR